MKLTLKVPLSPKRFSAGILLAADGRVPIEWAAKQIVVKALEEAFEPYLKNGLIFDFKNKPYPFRHYAEKRHSIADLGKLRAKEVDVYYTTFHFSASHSVKIDGCDLQLPSFLKSVGIYYGSGSTRHYELKVIKQKTKTLYKVNFLHLTISPTVFRSVSKVVDEKCRCPVSRLQAKQLENTPLDLRYICRRCGKHYFCSCFKKAHKRFLNAEQPKDDVSCNYYELREEMRSSFGLATYRDDLCFICTKRPERLEFAGNILAGSVMAPYAPYIEKKIVEQGMKPRDAENLMRVFIGIPKIGEGWVNETQLANIVKSLFPGQEVIREASPPWIGRLRLDVFIPELNLAIEYQGQQHFKPVDYFGGQEGHDRITERDHLKKVLCEKNGIDLIYFTHKEQIGDELVRKKLDRYLKSKRRSAD